MRRVEWRDAGAASESRHSAGLEPLRFELPNLQIERLRIEDLAQKKYPEGGHVSGKLP